MAPMADERPALDESLRGLGDLVSGEHSQKSHTHYRICQPDPAVFRLINLTRDLGPGARRVTISS